jgi:hypothetical protein
MSYHNGTALAPSPAGLLIDESSELISNTKRLRGGHECADLTVTANESIEKWKADHAT